MAPSRIIKEGSRLETVFVDGSVHPTTLKKRDQNLGLAILLIDRKSVSEMTLNTITTAVLGNSNQVNRGDLSIALGKQFGYSDGVGYGIISSKKNQKILVDRTCRILTTDIPAVPSGSGVLFNVKGEVIGLIDQSIGYNGNKTMMTAYAISDIKKDIELMSNGKSIPYIGITGVEITEEISQENGIPRGVYVSDVAVDSPAMAAGIQSGDVLTQLNKINVSTVLGYEAALLETEIGHEIKAKGLRLGSSEYVEVDFTVTVGSKE